MTTAMTGSANLRDQAWLDEQVATLGDGIEAARTIWSNWFEGRNVGRLHPGMSPGDYIASLGLRLTLPEAMAALPDGSSREIAAVAGVSRMTVQRAQTPVPFGTPDEPPTRVIGADGKSYPAHVVGTTTADIIEPDEARSDPSVDLAAFQAALSAWTAMRSTQPSAIAAAVFPSNVSHMRAELKRAHQWMGAIIIELDRR